MPYTLPLMAAIQEISARIGRTTGRGLARNMRLHYPALVVFPMILVLAAAHIINLSADSGAMGECLQMLIGGASWHGGFLYTFLFAGLSVFLQIVMSYKRYAAMLKWGALILGVYILTALVLHPHWGAVAKATFLPSFTFSRAYLATFVAVLGTTISPYL